MTAVNRAAGIQLHYAPDPEGLQYAKTLGAALGARARLAREDPKQSAQEINAAVEEELRASRLSPSQAMYWPEHVTRVMREVISKIQD